MRCQSSIRLLLVVAALAPGGAAFAEDKPGEAALKAKGLLKTGTTFVIEDEKAVLAKFKEARTALNAIAAMGDQRSLQEDLKLQGQQLQQQRQELQGQYEAINQQISATGTGSGNPMIPGGGAGGGYDPTGFPGVPAVSPLVGERERLRQELAQVAAEQTAIKSQMPQGKEAGKLDANLKKADESFKTTLAELRKLVDAVKQKYADLGADEGVKKPLAEAKASNAKIHLGPSDAFLAASKELDKAERHFLGKRPTPPAAATSTTKKTKGRK